MAAGKDNAASRGIGAVSVGGQQQLSSPLVVGPNRSLTRPALGHKVEGGLVA